jgi:hypothetical protein
MNEQYNLLGLALEIKDLERQDQEIERMRKELDGALILRAKTLRRIYQIAGQVREQSLLKPHQPAPESTGVEV